VNITRRDAQLPANASPVPGHISGEVGPTGDEANRLPRQERIAALVLERPFVAVKDLARMFGVSLMTIHRDLDLLERQGILRKVRGGATPQPSSVFESNARYRITVARAEKQALANRALTLIEPGQAVMLDDSTTVLTLARLLPALTPLTVLTNSLAVLQDLKAVKQLHMVVLGGDFLPRHNGFSGLVCEATIAAMRADILFMSSMAVSGGNLFQPDQELALVKRAMIGAAAKRVLLVDNSKFGRVALHRVTSLSAFDLVLVDDGINDAGLRQLQEAQVPYQIVPTA
jgi:DeoR/GlpR family transcriptional regulator of sugar metabolism